MPQYIGFRYKKHSESTWQEHLYTEGIKTSSGSFSVALDENLAPATDYDVVAFMYVWSGSAYVELTKEGQFRTKEASAYTPTGVLELPAVTGSEDLVVTMYKTGGTSGNEADRNYTINYSKNRYAALWTAYTLTEADVVGGQTSSGNWVANQSVFSGSYQVGVTTSKGSYPTNYVDADKYSRGHQIPNADRTSSTTANAQTYYLTNQTPQLQNKFNGSIWGALETAVRGFVVTQSGNTNYNGGYAKTDELYVITGPCYGKVGTSETPEYLTSNGTVQPEQVPIPMYYWKVLLKVKWNEDHTLVADACAIGFWYRHQEYAAGTSFYNSSYVKSVNQIESWTGFDLFANLPSGIEETVEANTSWETFRDF